MCAPIVRLAELFGAKLTPTPFIWTCKWSINGFDMLATSLSIELTSSRRLYSGLAADGVLMLGVDFWNFGDCELFVTMV